MTITAGPNAGERVRINRSPATFGRDPDNALVIDLPTVSRVHGELRFEDDRWVLVNHSANGTTINRKPVGRKPRPLQDRDQVVVGDQPVLVVALRESAEDERVVVSESRDIGPAAAPTPTAGMSARTRLWLVIAGFWAVVFTVVFVFVGLDSPEQRQSTADVPVLDDGQIAAAIRAPLPKREPSPRTATHYFDQAEGFYQLINADPQNVFRAYHGYKTALSYTFGGDFNDDRDDWGGKPRAELGIAQKRMLELEDRLIEEVTRLYKDAHGKLRDRRYRDAQVAFKRVMDLYQDPQSPIFSNALKQRDLARRRLAARS